MVSPEDEGGVAAARGFNYQVILAAYFLIVDEIREIEYEQKGEDVVIINEDVDHNSFEFIQAKDYSAGTFSLSMYCSEVFPQFWTAFEDAIVTHKDKPLYFTLYTSIAWNESLKKFMTNCEKFLENGITSEEFEKRVCKDRRDQKQFNKMKKGKTNHEFYRFIRGLSIQHSFSYELVEERIKYYMLQCGVKEPRKKLSLILQHILDKGQGRITRRQIEEIAGNRLLKKNDTSVTRARSKHDFSLALTNLNELSEICHAVGSYPDEEQIYRDLVRPIDRIVDTVLDFCKDEVTMTSKDSQEALEIIESDRQRIREDASLIAKYQTELWRVQTSYDKRIQSMATQSKYIELELEQSEEEL